MAGYLQLIRVHWPALAFGFLAVFWGNFGQTFFLGVFTAPIQQSLGLTAGTYGSVYSLATLLSAFTVVWAGSLIDRVPLRQYTTALCLGLSCAALLMFSAAGLPDLPDSKTADSAAAQKPGQVRKMLLSDCRYWLALPGLMAPPFIVTGVFIHQDFVIASQSWTPQWFATCFVIYGVVHWLTSILVGVLVDRFTAVQLMPFYLLPMALGLLGLAFLSGLWVAVLLMVLMAMTVGSVPAIIGALWPEVYGVEHLGTIRSMNMAMAVFATSLSPIVYGLSIDAGVDPDRLFMLSAVYVIGAALLLARSYRVAHAVPE